MSKRKFNVGDTVIINENCSMRDKILSTHNTLIGKIVEYTGCYYNNPYVVKIKSLNYNFAPKELTMADSAESLIMSQNDGSTYPSIVEYYEDRLFKLQAEIKRCERIIEFLEVHDLDNFSEKEYEIYNELEYVIEDPVARLNKAKTLVSLMNDKNG